MSAKAGTANAAITIPMPTILIDAATTAITA